MREYEHTSLPRTPERYNRRILKVQPGQVSSMPIAACSQVLKRRWRAAELKSTRQSRRGRRHVAGWQAVGRRGPAAAAPPLDAATEPTTRMQVQTSRRRCDHCSGSSASRLQGWAAAAIVASLGWPAAYQREAGSATMARLVIGTVAISVRMAATSKILFMLVAIFLAAMTRGRCGFPYSVHDAYDAAH
jgi:hypothetical protein